MLASLIRSTKPLLKSGDVVVLEFPGVHGSKRCPAVIVSSDLYHSVRPDCIAGLITSQVSAAISATDYALQDWNGAGLHVPSAFRAFLVTVPQQSVFKTIGQLSDRDWKEVRARLKNALAQLA